MEFLAHINSLKGSMTLRCLFVWMDSCYSGNVVAGMAPLRHQLSCKSTTYHPIFEPISSGLFLWGVFRPNQPRDWGSYLAPIDDELVALANGIPTYDCINQQ